MRILCTFICLGFAAGACASTQVNYTPTEPTQKVCQNPAERTSALVLWKPQWRPDQKEPANREAAAKQGFENFFHDGNCFVMTQLERTDAGSIAEYLRLAPAAAGKQKYLHITVRELGPIVKLFSSLALVEGGTEVVLDIEVLETRNSQMEKFRVHWQNGGPWTLKGVKTLSTDLMAALAAALTPA
jgi:hypothetical protein